MKNLFAMGAEPHTRNCRETTPSHPRAQILYQCALIIPKTEDVGHILLEYRICPKTAITEHHTIRESGYAERPDTHGFRLERFFLFESHDDPVARDRNNQFIAVFPRLP